jgi:hypothetical protein
MTNKQDLRKDSYNYKKESGLKRAKKRGRVRIRDSSALGHKNISINEKLALYLNDALSVHCIQQDRVL